MLWAIVTLSSLVALSGFACALFALRLARAAYVVRKTPVARFEAVERALADLTERHESLHTSFKKFQSRVGMRDLRQRRATEAEEDLPASGPDERAQLHRMLAGKIVT